ncbi:MAG: 3-hydroxyacyl-CoA dehydrogenase, partial [Alphaproteobacteria bacterium]
MADTLPHLKHWTFSVDFEGLGWLTIDTPKSPVNTLSREAITELDTIVATIEGMIPAGELKGIILLSAKDSGFIAGADVSEFDEMADPGVLTGALNRTHKLFD